MTATTRLGGARVLVVGASSGIGCAIATQAAARGARVVGAARRREGRAGVVCDVRDRDACERTVAAAAAELGGLDLLVYAAGIAPLALLASADERLWSAVLATNVVGAAYVACAAAPALARASGRGVFLSSDSVGRPRAGLVPYTASKAALEQLVLGLGAEHPEVRWESVVVGPTATGIAAAWNRELAVRLAPSWRAAGHDALAGSPEDVAERILAALAEGEPLEGGPA